MNKNDHLIWSNDPATRKRSGKENEKTLGSIREDLEIYLCQPILLIGRFAGYDGEKTGIHELESRNIGECLYSNCEKVTWYVDQKGDFRCDAVHEIGKNHYLYRAWKEDVNDRQKHLLIDRIHSGKPADSEISRFTRSIGKEIGRKYGWKFDKKKSGRRTAYEPDS